MVTHAEQKPGPGATAPFHVILMCPEIPQNTGNIMRLCAATGTVLHLVGPLGFRLDAAGVRRAGMDYRHLSQVVRHDDWPSYWATHPGGAPLYALSTHGDQPYTTCAFRPGDRLLFGSEGSGLPVDIRTQLQPHLVRIPMLGTARSLNLANAVSVVLYEALRQNTFPNLA
ncbi:MAG: tRNA (cytidine(34)-2'-O)-methyltransferase [Magnetococcales bacterium]|nr:tRNA (cytidine(34)-2'-O)-methyltransferase [Magnetococcales bacterium]